MNESDGSSIGSNTIATSFDNSQLSSLQQSALKLLKSRIFLGRYVERRLVNESVGYRDLVLVSAAEEELQRDLSEAMQWFNNLYPVSHWIGITDTKNLSEYKPGIILWTEIDDKPFGAFWFQIKTIQIRMNEVLVQLKCLRHITDRFLELEPFLVRPGRPAKENNKELAEESITEDYKEIFVNLKNNFTLKNVKDGFFFLIALVIAVVTGSFAFVSYLGNFVLSLVRELSLLVNNSTPIFLGFLDFISKIVGGFYILLAMIFKQTSPSSAPGRQIEYKHNRNKNNKYNDFSDHTAEDFD